MKAIRRLIGALYGARPDEAPETRSKEVARKSEPAIKPVAPERVYFFKDKETCLPVTHFKVTDDNLRTAVLSYPGATLAGVRFAGEGVLPARHLWPEFVGQYWVATESAGDGEIK